MSEIEHSQPDSEVQPDYSNYNKPKKNKHIKLETKEEKELYQKYCRQKALVYKKATLSVK